MYERLRMVFASPVVVASGTQALDFVLFARGTAAKLSNALQELAEHLRSVQLHTTLLHVPASILEELDSNTTSLSALAASLNMTLDHVRMSTHNALLEGKS